MKNWCARVPPSESSPITRSNRSRGVQSRRGETYAALERYRALPRIDDSPVWSVVCLFVDRRFRRKGLTGSLLRAAVDFARAHNVPIVEGYPVAPDAPSYTYMGSPETFRRAGFVDVTPAGQKRLVMRYNQFSEESLSF